MDFLMIDKKGGHDQCLISNTYIRSMNPAQCFFFLQIVLIFFIIIHSTLLNVFYWGVVFWGRNKLLIAIKLLFV